MKLKQYYHTIRDLKYIQIRYRIKYLIKRRYIERNGDSVFRRYVKAFQHVKSSLTPSDDFVLNDRKHYKGDLERLLHNQITFLNHEIDFGETIDWHLPELNRGTRLWKLNLNYHEFLIDVAYAFKDSGDSKYLNYIVETINNWLAQNPLGTKGYGKDNWNSYAISLRLVSWCKIYSTVGNHFSAVFDEKFKKYFWIQAYFLSDNLEYDILGNHFIKNWKCLHWCGKMLNDNNLTHLANSLYSKYIASQFSDRGSHEELSPMYSGIVLEDLIEVFIISPEDNALGHLIQEVYHNLEQMIFDDQYAFFNDSILNNGVQFRDLESFYAKVNALSRKEIDSSFLDLDNYLVLRTKDEHIIVDFAKVILGKQPGHLHCDSLSFEYARKGQKIFTNSGTYEYNAGNRRSYSRSTEAHNTLKYGQFDQSEIWGAFRVAKKAQVGCRVLHYDRDSFEAEGSVCGFNFKKDISHQRTLKKEKDYIYIADKLISNENDSTRSVIYFHLCPSFEFRKYSVNNFLICYCQKSIAIGELTCNHQAHVVETDYYPEFGLKETKHTLIVDNISVNKEVITTIKFYG